MSAVNEENSQFLYTQCCSIFSISIVSKVWLSLAAARNDRHPQSLTENMGGRSVHQEPTLLQVTEQAREILHRLGWTEYFN
jgi:hypothetical protein